MNDAMLRAACDAERAHDGASSCHFCPERCSNDALAAAIRAAMGKALAEIDKMRVGAREMLEAVERAEAERDALKIECYAIGENYEIAKREQLLAEAERAAARAEAERLRTALRNIVQCWDWWADDSYNRCQSVPGDAIEEARALLEDAER